MLGIDSHGRSQGVPKIIRAPMYRAHCAVIFAITRLSCSVGSRVLAAGMHSYSWIKYVLCYRLTSCDRLLTLLAVVIFRLYNHLQSQACNTAA